MAIRIEDFDLGVTKDLVFILQNAGSIGGPGMPEWGQLPILQKLLKEGVRDTGPYFGRTHERDVLWRLRA